MNTGDASCIQAKAALSFRQESTHEEAAPGVKEVAVALHFAPPSGYIGQPFWPERNTIINIMKDVHPKLGDAKKAAAVAASCEKRGIDPLDLPRLQARADRPFYTVDDSRDGEIVIPQRIFQSFLNHGSMAAPKAIPRVPDKGLTFIGALIAGGWLRTGQTIRDAKLFSRFVKLEESNQRTFSESYYITDFDAVGTLLVDEEIIKADDLRTLVEWAGRRIGIGSARPQGYGRFTVARWTPEPKP